LFFKKMVQRVVALHLCGFGCALAIVHFHIGKYTGLVIIECKLTKNKRKKCKSIQD